MFMRKHIWIFSCIVFGMLLILGACGEKSADDVIGKMKKNIESMEGYQAKAEMTMNTGQEEQTYMIDVMHKKDDLYRVALSNPEDDEGGQVILKNEEGVFVLTPSLNKSFKFKTEWPDNSSQPYLYQS